MFRASIVVDEIHFVKQRPQQVLGLLHPIAALQLLLGGVLLIEGGAINESTSLARLSGALSATKLTTRSGVGILLVRSSVTRRMNSRSVDFSAGATPASFMAANRYRSMVLEEVRLSGGFHHRARFPRRQGIRHHASQGAQTKLPFLQPGMGELFTVRSEKRAVAVIHQVVWFILRLD